MVCCSPSNLLALGFEALKVQERKGRLFCFLPVGEVQVPFQVHVHGGFEMLSSRKALDEKNQWNLQVRDQAIKDAYLHAIQAAKNVISKIPATSREDVKKLAGWFYGLWPCLRYEEVLFWSLFFGFQRF